MPEHDDIELTERELQLERELTDLGPVMHAASRARVEAPDPAFLTALRTRLVEPEPVAPDRGFEKRLRDRLVGRRRAFPWRPGAFAGAAVAAALVVLLVLHPFTRRSERAPAAVGIPQPSQADLTRGYPPSGIAGGGGGYLSPTASRLEGPHGAYSGHLHLTAGPFPSVPGSLPIYRLAARPLPGSSLQETARRLHIKGKAGCMNPLTAQPARCDEATWRFVAENLYPSRNPLHSIAVSPIGEVIYHDVAYDQLAYRGPALSPGRAVTVGRSWLELLGWPASRMPVLSASPARTAEPPGAGSPIAVSFGWQAGVHAAVPAATLWVAPTDRVVEALLWPPIVRRQVAAVRDISEAWRDVAAGRAPVAVAGALFPLPGKGTTSTVTVVQVLVTPAHGPSYLEPAFRFSGTVTLANGRGMHPWYALVPAVARQ